MSRLKDIDLYRQYRKTAPGKGKISGKVLKVIPLVLVAAALSAVWFLCQNENWVQEAIVSDTTDAASDVTLLDDVAKSQLLQAETATIQGALTRTKQLEEALAGYPVVTSGMLRTVERCGGSAVSVVLQSYDSKSGLLRFAAVTKEVLDIPSYIYTLEETGLFVLVNYTGYQYSGPAGNTVDTDDSGVYSISVACYLKAREEVPK